MKLKLPKFLARPESTRKEVKTTKATMKNQTNDIPQLSPQTAIWVGATLVFATLFFLSAVLDMKVNVTFGNQPATGVTRTAAPATAPASGGGIASQVGGC